MRRERENPIWVFLAAGMIFACSLLANRYWLFHSGYFPSDTFEMASPEWYDPWFYFGFILDFRRTMALEAGHWYFGSRLGWILPGVWFNQLPWSRAAGYFWLQSFFYVGMIFWNFLFLRERFRPSSAALGTMLLVFSTPILMGFTWPYGHSAVFFFLACSAFLSQVATRKRSALLAVSGGAIYFLALTCNAIIIVFAPVYLLLGGGETRKVARYWIAWTAGAVACYAVISGIYWKYTGSWFLWATSFRGVKEIAVRPGLNPWSLILSWPFQVPWMGFLTAAIILTAWRGWRDQGNLRSLGLPRNFFLWTFLSLSSLFVLLRAGLRLTTFDYFFYSFYLTLPATWFFAEAFERSAGTRPVRNEWIYCGIFLFLGLACFFPATGEACLRLFRSTGYPIVIATASLAISALGMLYFRAVLPIGVAAALVMGVVNAGSAPEGWARKLRQGVEKADLLDLISDVRIVIAQRQLKEGSWFVWGMWTEHPTKIWDNPVLSEKIDLTPVQGASTPFALPIVMSLYPDHSQPSFPWIVSSGSRLVSGRTVILVTGAVLSTDALNQVLRAYGKRAEHVETVPVSHGAASVFLSFFELAPGEQPSSSIDRPRIPS